MAPSDREAELFDAMFDAPADSAPGLVYADLLLERGDERGELIHLYVQGSDPAPQVLARRQKLMAPVIKSILRCGGKIHHELAANGWIWHVEISATALLDHLELVFALGPLHHLRISGAKDRIPELAACRHLRWVCALELMNNDLTAEELDELLASPHLARLHSLDLHGNKIGPHLGVALAATAFDRIRSLEVGFCELGNAGAVALATAPWLPALDSLALTANLFDDRGLAPVLAAVRDLTTLRLSHNRQLSSAGAIAIAGASHLDKLETLSLGDCGIDDDGVEALASAPHLSKVTWFNLDSNAFGTRGAAALIASPLPSSCRLSAAGNMLDLDSRLALDDRFRT